MEECVRLLRAWHFCILINLNASSYLCFPSLFSAVNRQVKSLSAVSTVYRGKDGEAGSSQNCFGRNASSSYIAVSFPHKHMQDDLCVKSRVPSNALNAGSCRHACQRGGQDAGRPLAARPAVYGGVRRCGGEGEPLLPDQWEQSAPDRHARREGPGACGSAGATHHGPRRTGQCSKTILSLPCPSRPVCTLLFCGKILKTMLAVSHHWLP